MKRATHETFIHKVKRIYLTEGFYGISTRIWGRLLCLYASVKTMIPSFRKAFFEALSRGRKFLVKLWARMRVRREPILIYQVGKVGSMTMEAALKKAYQDINIDVSIYRGHSLMNFEKYAEYIRTNRGNSSDMLKRLEEMKELRRKIDGEPDQLWNLLSMVRDPVARNIAAFFQNIDFYLPEWKVLWENKTLSMQTIRECFFENEEINSPFWFENRLEPVFGIDVYASPFPHQTGYNIYRNPPRANLLLIRLEDLNRVAADAIYRFLKLPKFQLKGTNVGDQKPYADVYRAFRKTPLPKFYVERMYSTKLARHFYTKEELDAFAYKWTRETL